MFEIVSGPQVQRLAAHHVERRFMVLVDVGLGAPAGRQCHQTEPDDLRADSLCAHARLVVRPLFDPMFGTCLDHHAPSRCRPRETASSLRSRCSLLFLVV